MSSSELPSGCVSLRELGFASRDLQHAPYLILNAIGGSRDGLVLPNAENAPADRQDGSIDCSIALDIASELRTPVILIHSRLVGVDWTDMPETSIYEHRHPCAGEGDVGVDDSYGNP